MDLIQTIGEYVAAVATLGAVVLMPLFVSQRRDLERLREWMEREPDHPAADVAASEVILDRAEAELEALQGVPQPVAAPALSPAARVTGDRPALERITMEREALQPHPRWRHFVSIATQPRTLGLVAAVAMVVGVGVIFASGRLLEGDETGSRQPRPGAIDPADVSVAVLNGTSVPGLAARVSDDVEVNGFELGSVTNSERPYGQTVVMFAGGQERAAQRVAHALGVQPVQPIDGGTARLAGGADVVVIAGQDRATG